MARRISLVAILFGALAILSVAQAQDQGGRRSDGGTAQQPAQGQDHGSRRGNFDPAQMRDRMMTGIKEQLGVNDDEWKVLTPKVEKVMSLQRDTRGGFRGFGGRDHGDRPGGSDQPQSKVAQAQRDLSTTLQNKSASTEEITKKLAALREAREKAKAELLTAQKALKEVVTPRQEAVLVISGMLD